MNPVQFDPKISPEFQIDWRRRSSQSGADPFTDFLKQHFDSERPRAPRKREEAADPLSGRKPHVAVSHPKTLRGEAKRVEDADRRLPDHGSRPGAKAGAKKENAAPLEDGVTTEADASKQDAAAVAGETKQPAPAAEDKAAAPAAPGVVAVQSTSKAKADGVPIATATPVVEPAQDGVPPEQSDQAAADTASSGAKANPEATTEEQAVVAMAGASLADGVTALMTDQAAPAEDAAPASPAAAATPAISATPAAPALTPLQIEQVPAPMVEPAAIAPARPERSSMDIKLRASASPHATPAAPASPATPAAPAQPAQPQAAALPQPATGSEFDSLGEPFDPTLSDGSTGQGWGLHLAQGAAIKRPDFVAQLRQHLQNLPAHEQVAIHLQRAVREGTNKFSIQLSPAELGNIHVKLEIDEEKRVTASVTVERPSTLELLQRDTKGLERALHNAGLNMEGGDLSFSLGRGDQEFAQDLRQSGAAAAGGPVLDAESDGRLPEIPVVQVTDTAAGVVNLQV